MAPPIYVKGGVWTNAEDQILKAAVSKYGLTQWARVASLLPKKTAKQAKARWNEYLNPSIDRTKWTPQDDEKLLNLAKVLPNQWRSIAPIMGRTATQCVERYQKLLDDAVRDEDEDSDEELKDMGLSGPGIETLPALGNAFESLPALPDAEDMDDDEREMISEAKARLANTQGKKATRKERERMLNESKRIATLQKRRELKAAGINTSLVLKNRAKRKEFDYNADIPHEREPLPGLYDVTSENSRNDDETLKFQKQVKFKGLKDTELGKKDKPKSEDMRVKGQLRSAAEVVTAVDEAQAKKRRKLELPSPGESLDHAIGDRVKALSQDLLGDKGNGAGGALKRHTAPPTIVAEKKIKATLKELLKKLPSPEHHDVVVLPQLGIELGHEDVLDASTEVVQTNKTEDKANKTVDKAIESEVLSRVMNLPKNEIDDAKVTLTDNIELHVNELLESVKPVSTGKAYQLPHTEEATDIVFDFLEELYSLANAKDAAVQAETAPQEEQHDVARGEVFENFGQIASLNSQLRQLRDWELEDQNAIHGRSSRLHTLVEDVRSTLRRLPQRK